MVAIVTMVTIQDGRQSEKCIMPRPNYLMNRKRLDAQIFAEGYKHVELWFRLKTFPLD